MELPEGEQMSIDIEVDTTRRFKIKVSCSKVRALVAADMEQNPLNYKGIGVQEIPPGAFVCAVGRDDQGDSADLDVIEEIHFEWTEND